MSPNFKITLVDSNFKIEQNILKAMEDELKVILNKARPKIHAEIINLVIGALEACPEIQSLQGGKLQMDFGLSEDVTHEIIYAIANSTHVYFKNVRLYKKSASAALSVYIQPEDFRNILSLSGASVKTDKGQTIPWLEWLLTAGDAVLITQYHVDYGNYPKSRSGGAVMKPSGIFKVDSAFSGTAEDNFITRALEKKQDEILNIIRKSI
jgi:hypothetical protein